MKKTKKTNKVILSSILTIALFVSVIAGSTFALFSSRSNVNIAITSGKVDVVASVDTDTLTGYSAEWDETKMAYVDKEMPLGTFENGGTYSYEAGALALNKIAPGDSVEFDLGVENKSDIAIKYRVQLTVPEKKGDGEAQDKVVQVLKVTFGEGEEAKQLTIGELTTIAQNWSNPIAPGVAITEKTHVRIEFPMTDENDNIYQGQGCLLHIGVYAVQSNAHVTDPEGYTVYTAKDLISLQASHSTFKNETITLGANVNLSPDSDGGASTLSVVLADVAPIASSSQRQKIWYFGMNYQGYGWSFQGHFNGNGYTISNFMNYDGKGNGYGTDNYPFGLFARATNATIENVVLSNVSMVVDSFYSGGNDDAARSSYVGIVAGQATNTVFRNITVKDSTVISKTDYTKKVKQYTAGHRHAQTLEEYQNGEHGEGGPIMNGAKPYPIVGYDFVGALVGQIKGDTTIENVNITLNEDVEELTGKKLFGNTPDFGPENATRTVAYNVKFNGESTLECVPAEGISETLKFDANHNGTQESEVAAPTPKVEIGTAAGLASLAQSVSNGRDYEDLTITLTDDIDLTDTELVSGGETFFKGSVNGNGKKISGLKFESLGQNVENVSVKDISLEFVADELTIDNVTDPDSAFAADNVTYTNASIKVTSPTLSYTITYGEEETLTSASYEGDGYKFDGDQVLANGVDYSFNGLTFGGKLTAENETTLVLTDNVFDSASAISLASVENVIDVALKEGSKFTGNVINGGIALKGGTVYFVGNKVTNSDLFISLSDGAQAIITNDNSLNDAELAYDKIGGEGYGFVAWNVMLDKANKIASGMAALGTTDKETFMGFATENPQVLFYDNKTGLCMNTNDEYLLDSAEAVDKLSTFINAQEETPNVSAILTADIYLDKAAEDLEWTEGKKFHGTIDGQGHVVYGLHSSPSEYGGTELHYDTYYKNVLFCNMDSGSTLKDIAFIFDSYNMGSGGGPESYVDQGVTLDKVFVLQKPYSVSDGQYIYNVKYIYNEDGKNKNQSASRYDIYGTYKYTLRELLFNHKIISANTNKAALEYLTERFERFMID